MKFIKPDIEGSFVIACSTEDGQVYEHFNPEHLLVYQLSGQTQIFYEQKSIILKQNEILLARKNQLLKSIKPTSSKEESKVIAVVLKSEDLQKYTSLYTNGQCRLGQYTGKPNLVFQSDPYIHSYFESLTPYLIHSDGFNKRMIFSKITEIIELLLNRDTDLYDFLFDFSELHKVDLEKVMLLNYRYNTSLENFAKLTGRSLATFKRDFIKVFGTSPARWLKQKRLEEAHYLIVEKGEKPKDIYLKLGFENLSHFYKVFKQQYGVPPGEID